MKQIFFRIKQTNYSNSSSFLFKSQSIDDMRDADLRDVLLGTNAKEKWLFEPDDFLAEEATEGSEMNAVALMAVVL